jgi:MFS family permease
LQGLRNPWAREHCYTHPNDGASPGQPVKNSVKNSLWRLPDFRNLWLAQAVSLLGSQVSVLAFPLMALTLLHASVIQVSLLRSVQFLPSLLLGLPVGVWVERLPRRPVLIVSDVVRGIAMASIPVTYAFHALRLPLLFVVAFVIGLGMVFFDVAQLSYLPTLVGQERLADGNSKLEGSRSFALLAGPSVGGFLVQFFTAPVAIAVDVFSYAVSAVFLSLVRGRSDPEPIEQLSLREEISEGVRFIFSHPLLRPLTLCGGVANLALSSVLTLQVPYGVKTLHLDAGTIGVILAIGSGGGLFGAVISGKVVKRFGPGPSILACLVMCSIGVVFVPLAAEAVVFALGLFVVDASTVIFSVVAMTLCQTVTPARLLGRVLATARFVSWGTLPLGSAVGGMLVAPLGLRGVLWGAAAMFGLSMLPPLFSQIRSLRQAPAAPGGETVEAFETRSAA